MKKNTIKVLLVLFLTGTIGVVDGAINMINNPGFESGTTSWSFYTNGAGAFSAVSPGFEGINAGKVVLSSIGSNMQLFQSGITLEANTRYRLTFSAYSTTGHDVSVILIKSVSPYTNYGLSKTFNLGTSWMNFTTEFNTSGFAGTVNDGRLAFRFNGFASAGDIYNIDAIVLEKVVAGGDISPPTVIGNTPTGTGVPVTTKITVNFNEPMTQASAQSAFSTSPATSGSFSWGGNIMTYTPVSSLSSGTTYTVTIGTGAKDLAGNSLQSPYSWSFTTSGGSSSIEARLAALEANMIDLKTKNTALEANMTALKNENAALKNLLAGVSRTGNNIYIDGANLHIRDGSGSTDGPVNGLGNLIIGYNEDPPCKPNLECKFKNIVSGSHNLILGSVNSYSSYGGLIAGKNNYISGPYASISGGQYNTASNESSSVSGGQYNKASGVMSSISGGQSNIASGDISSVSGGNSNIASNSISSVSGGYRNTARGVWSSVSGGGLNIAHGWSSSVSGGNSNKANGSDSSVSGGLYNTASNDASSVSGGYSNTASGAYSSVSGGQYNTASGQYSSVSGGGDEPGYIEGGYYSNGNLASGKASWVGGGQLNSAIGGMSSVSGGYNNIASGDWSSVSAGSSNSAYSSYSTVSGGQLNSASGDYSSVSAGSNNRASYYHSSVSGGINNIASGLHSSVSGGNSNTASGEDSSVSAGGSNKAENKFSSVSGGWGNTASGLSSSVSGGVTNTATNSDSSVSGGYANVANGLRSSVSGGLGRYAAGPYDWVAGGLFQDQ